MWHGLLKSDKNECLNQKSTAHVQLWGNAKRQHNQYQESHLLYWEEKGPWQRLPNSPAKSQELTQALRGQRRRKRNLWTTASHRIVLEYKGLYMKYTYHMYESYFHKKQVCHLDVIRISKQPSHPGERPRRCGVPRTCRGWGQLMAWTEAGLISCKGGYLVNHKTWKNEGNGKGRLVNQVIRAAVLN